MPSKPLILSPAYDIHAAAVTWGLRQMGVDALWSRSASLADTAVGDLSFHTEGECVFALSSDRIHSIWYRRARAPEYFPGAAICDVEFLREEWGLFQRNFWAIVGSDPDVFWVNSPAAARDAENKLLQLNAAIACGLRVPPTLVSNDPAAVARFRKQHAQVIYKSFSVHSWMDEGASSGHIAHACLLDADLVIGDESVRLCPGIYQGYVDKVADLRVTVIGDRYFATKVGTKVGSAFVDWRSHINSEQFMAEGCELPGPIWQKLQRLLARLGLVFGCIDLVLDRSGELHFLEVNQSGQFLFAERWAESQPLLQAMCAMLAAGRADYDLDSDRRISYQAFRDSDAYQAWLDDYRQWVPSERERKATLTLEPSVRVA